MKINLSKTLCSLYTDHLIVMDCYDGVTFFRPIFVLSLLYKHLSLVVDCRFWNCFKLEFVGIFSKDELINDSFFLQGPQRLAVFSN